LVAVNRSDELILKVEAKQLYKCNMARSLGTDWERLKTAALPCQHRPLSQTFQRYCCLLASCWDKAYLKWWCDRSRQEKPCNAGNTTNWSALRGALMEADSHGLQGALSVHRNDEAWLLYAVAPLPSIS
jgi:hypothetical protein